MSANPKSTRLREVRRLLVRAADEFDRFEWKTDRIVKSVFRRYRTNGRRDEVEIKVTLLNSLYSAGVRDTRSVAKRIHRIHRTLDPMLRSGSLSAVRLIETGHGVATRNGTERRFHSFATKYAHWHNMAAFPVFDSYARNALWKILGVIQDETRWTKSGLDDYRTYFRAVESCKMLLGLKSGKWRGFKRIDEALWVVGERLGQRSNPDRFEDYDTWNTGRVPRFLS